MELAAGEEGVEEGVEGVEGRGAAEGRDGEEGAGGTCGEACACVEGDDVAEEGFGNGVASVVAEHVEDLFHLGDHSGAAQLGDDEVVGEEGVPEWPVTLGRVEEELECEGWVILGTEEGGESERSYCHLAFRTRH